MSISKLSVIIPAYNEEKTLESTCARLDAFLSAHYPEYEIVFVNDGSSDDTLDRIRQLRSRDRRICYIDLSRNFGKERAMMAGFDHVTGHCAAIIDADLQHPPMVIGQMLELWEQGYHDVYAKRLSRGRESFLRKHFTRLYYAVLKKLADTEVLTNVGDFRLLDRRCIDALRQLRETQRYTKGLYCWIGFRKQFVLFETADRTDGRSSFSMKKLFNLAVEGITSYSTTPLRLATAAGIVVSMAAFLYMCYVLIKTLIIGDPVTGYPTLVILLLFLGGLQLLTIGIIGEYLGRIFNETKNRPVYIVNDKETNDNQPSD